MSADDSRPDRLTRIGGGIGKAVLSAVVVSLLTTRALLAEEAPAEDAPHPGTAAAAREAWADPFETDHAIRVITGEEIWRGNARNLPDLLRQELGLWMTFANDAGGSPVVRGLTGEDVLILLDGIKVNVTAYRFGALEYLSTVDLFMLERIEVIGGGAGRYGGDSSGPVIRLYTKRDAAPASGDSVAPEEPVARTFFRYSTVDKSSIAHVEAHGEEERYAFMFGLTSRDIGDLKGGGTVGFQRITAYEEVAGNARLDYFLTDSSTLEVEAQIHEQQNVPQYDRVEGGSHLVFDLDPRKRALFSVNYLDRTDRSWADGLRASLYLQQHRQRALEQLTATPEVRSQTSDNNDVMGLLAEGSVRLGERHRLRYGLELTEEEISAVRREIEVLTGKELTRGPDPRRDGQGRDQTSVWIEDRVSLGERVDLRLGGRWASYSVSGMQATPAGTFELDAADSGVSTWIGLLWRASETVHLFGGFDHGFRLPGIDEVTSHTPDEELVSLPNSELLASSIDTLELGGRWRSENLSVDIALFRRQVTDSPLLVPAAGSGPLAGPGSNAPVGLPRWVRTENLGEGEVDGIELSFDATLPLDLRLWGSYLAAEGNDPRTGAALTGMPPAHGAIGLRWEGPWTWRPWVEGLYRHTSRKDRLSPSEEIDPDLDPSSLESWDTFTLRGGVTLPPRLRILFTLENPADEAYLPYGSFLYAPGRNLALSAEYVF